MGDERELKYKLTGDVAGLVAASKQGGAALQELDKKSGAIKLLPLTDQDKANLAGMTQEVDKSGGAIQELGRKHAFLGLKTGELKKLTRELSHEFPVAGMAARAMINPIVAAFTGAIMVFGYAKTKIEEWNRAMDETAARNADQQFLPGIDAKKAAMTEAATAAANFAQSLGAIGATEDAFAGKIKIAIDRLHEFIAAQAEVTSAVEANEIAKVNLQEKLGRITPEQGIVQRAGIAEKYRKIGDQRKTEAENQELGLKQEEYQHAVAQDPALVADEAAKRRERDRLKARAAQRSADLEKAKAQLVELQADANKKEALAGDNWGPTGSGQDTPEGIAARKAMAAVEGKQQEIRRLEGAVKSLSGEKLAPAEEAEKVAATKATENRQRIEALEKEIAALKATLPIRQGARAAASGIKSGTEAMNTEGALAGTERGKAIAEAAETARLLKAGQKVSEAAQMQMQQVADVLEGTHVSIQEAVRLMSQSVQTTGSLADFTGELKKRVDALERKVGMMR